MKNNIFEGVRSIFLLILLLALFVFLDSLGSIWEKQTPQKLERLTYIPQFVLISFDGSKSVELWKDLRLFKEKMKAEGKRLNFTHFINTAYFLTPETRNFYPQRIDIGVSEGIEDLRERVREVNMAIVGGDEIAPHTTGHLSGRGWSKDQWKDELLSFDNILFNLDTLYPGLQLPALNLKREDIIGFRAPYLDISAGLYEALPELGFKYDTSEIGPGNAWPTKDEKGLWRIPLGTLFLGPGRIPVLAMDYNIYVHHTYARDILKKGTSEWQKAYDETLAAWRDYFNRNYRGNRAPVLVGYHFGDWNDNLYWDMMKNFAQEVCGLPEVHCGTYRELVKYMEEYGVPKSE